MSTLAVDSIENLAGDERFGPVLMTEQAMGGAVSVDFTSIPSWAKKITIMFENINGSGSSNKVIRVGNATDGVVSTGYTRQFAYISDSAAADGDAITDYTAGFTFYDVGSPCHGIAELYRMDSGGLKWMCKGMATIDAASDQLQLVVGYVTMSYALDRVRLTSANGSDTATGNVNVIYE